MTWLETRSSREFEKHLRYPETIGILFWCCIRKWSLWPNLDHFGPAIRGQSHLFHSKISQKLAKVLKKHLLQLFILVIIRHFHCKIYRNLSKIWKKRLVQVKHIYSGSSFFPGNKIASVYRSWQVLLQIEIQWKIENYVKWWDFEGNISRIDRDMHSMFSDTVKDVILYLDSKYRLVTSTERRDMPW